MNILTDEEINAIWSEPLETSKLSPFGLARIQAIIDATVKALAAGVSVEPVAWVNKSNLVSAEIDRKRYPGGHGDQHTWRGFETDYHKAPLYTAEAIAAARVAALEEAAKLVEYHMDVNEPWLNGDDVRALIGAKT